MEKYEPHTFPPNQMLSDCVIVSIGLDRLKLSEILFLLFLQIESWMSDINGNKSRKKRRKKKSIRFIIVAIRDLVSVCCERLLFS